MSADRPISAVVVSYFTGPSLMECLDALAADSAITEVVLVDNGNPQAIEQSLDDRATLDPRLRVVRGHGNVGFAAACNRGATIAKGAALLFANPDAVITAGAASLMCAAALDHAARPVVVGGRVFDPDGKEQRGCRREAFTPWSVLVSFSGLSRLERLIPALRDIHRERDPVPKGPTPVPVISGAFFLMLREDFEALQGIDEGYFLHVEDIDLCRRAKEAGGAVLFHPQATAMHWRSTSAAPRLSVERHKAASFRRYFRKFARTPMDRLAAAVLTPLIGVALMARARLSGRA